MSEELNISIMAEAETETVVESAPAPSLAEAYEANHADSSGEQESRKKQRSERNTTLSQEADTAREIAESGRQRHIVKTQPEQSLADAFQGTASPEAEQFELPEAFTAYAPEDIEAVLGLMGLTEDDLKEPRFAALALKELEASFQPAGEEESSEEPEQTEDETEKPKEKPEEKSEEKKPAATLPSTLAELTEEQRVEMNKHVEQVWERTQKTNAGPYHENFVKSLAGILETPPEHMQSLDRTIQALEWGAQSIVETAVPAVVTEYLQQHIVAIFRQVLPQVFPEALESYMPGASADYSERTLTSVWNGVRGDLPEFSMEADSQFQELSKKLPPELASWEPKAPDGSALPVRVALKAKAEVVAKLMRGEKAGPRALQEAVVAALEHGRRSAERSNRRVSAGRALGKGHTAGTIGKQERSETSLRDAYSAVHDRDGGIV
jgi:hypothetical protein